MTDVIRMMAAEGITKQDIMAIRPILRTWIGGGWHDGPQLARLLAKHEQTLAKFKPTAPVKLWRNERTPGPNGHVGIELNNHGAADQYTRPTAWSAERMSAETYASGHGRQLVTALVSPEDIYCSIPLVDYWCSKLGLKPIDEHRQSEMIVKPNPTFLAQIRRPVARQDEQALRQELEQAMLAAYLPELAKAQQEGRKVISEQELRSRLSGVARDMHVEDLPEKIREWQGRKVASAFCYGVVAAFTYKPKREWKDYTLVLLDVDKVEASYSKDENFYVGPQGAGGIGTRYQRFQQWLEANPNTPIDPPMIGLTPSKTIIFGDGRHRWAVLRDMGEKRIPALVPREDLKKMQELFGVGQAKAAREEQWGLDSLKKWFAGSKIVDAKGNPLPVHHGSTRGGISQSTVQFSFFTPDKTVATTYSKDDTQDSHGDNPTVQSFYLRILNPLEVDAQGAPWMRIPFEGRVYTTNDLAGLAKRRGHDGLIIRNVEDNVNDEELPPADVIVTLGGRAQIKSAETNSGAFSPEDHSVFAKVASKTLYHGTSLARAKKIMQDGLEPQVGSLVQTAYGDEGDYDFEPLAFAADKQGINRGVYSAMLHAISAEGHDTTDRETAIRNYGAIVVLKDGEDQMEHRPDGEGAEFDYTDHPLQVETGDYYSREGLVPDYVITGPALVRFFKRNGGDFLHRGLNPKRVNALIGMVRRAHPDKDPNVIVEKVWSLSPQEFSKSWTYYSNLPTSKAASYEDETQTIKDNRQKATKPHKFQAGEWTFPNGHPRCLICGDEETLDGQCPGIPVGKRAATTPRIVFHGQQTTDKPRRQNGILWAAPDQHMAMNYANTYWRKGVPTLWAITLNPSARIADLWDLSNPVIREIKDQVAAERKMQFGLGISDAAWDSYADFSILETKRWVLDALKKARVDAVWVHDTEHMGGGDQRNSLAILTDRAITSVTNVTPKVPKSASLTKEDIEGRRQALLAFFPADLVQEAIDAAPGKTAGLSGFNVNDSEFPWTQWILEGKKTIETRNSPSLNAHVGERVGIIRTGGRGPAALVGYCTLGQPKVYRSNTEFRADDALHLVPQGSGFDIPPGGVKYGYPISNVEPCEPQRVEAQGRVWRRLAAEAVTV